MVTTDAGDGLLGRSGNEHAQVEGGSSRRKEPIMKHWPVLQSSHQHEANSIAICALRNPRASFLDETLTNTGSLPEQHRIQIRQGEGVMQPCQASYLFRKDR